MKAWFGGTRHGLLGLVIAGSFFAMPAAFRPAFAQEVPAIDLLVLYTAKASAEFERRDRDIEAEIAYVGKMQNHIFANSGVTATVNLIPELWDEYDEDAEITGGALCDPQTLNCVAFNYQVGLLTTIERDTLATDKFGILARRKAANADLVSLWMWRGGWDTTGSAAATLRAYPYSQGAAVASQGYFLSLIVAEKAWLYWHFAHELGHNLGLPDFDGEPAEFIRPDGFGYVDVQYGFRTIMASDGRCEFSTCLRIPAYSNELPGFTYFGRPLGATGFNEAATLNETAPFVASYSDYIP